MSQAPSSSLAVNLWSAGLLEWQTPTHSTGRQEFDSPGSSTLRQSGEEWKQLSRVRLCDPMDCSPPGSSVYGILQARILEWVAMPSFRGSSQPRDQTQVSLIAGRSFIIMRRERETPLSLSPTLMPTRVCFPNPRYLYTTLTICHVVPVLFDIFLHINSPFKNFQIYFEISFIILPEVEN